MPWTLSEFDYELHQDPERHVLFVEGNRDVAFWKSVVPFVERGNSVVYPISELDIPVPVQGGHRGRLLWYAAQVSGSPHRGRILFFVDADQDRILGIDGPENVIFTDGRDLESYALTESCFCGSASKAWL
jgi:hypothetical protein